MVTTRKHEKLPSFGALFRRQAVTYVLLVIVLVSGAEILMNGFTVLTTSQFGYEIGALVVVAILGAAAEVAVTVSRRNRE